MRTLIVVAAVVVALTAWSGAGRCEDNACTLRCSVVYTAEVRKCEHEPSCLAAAHQKYDECAAKCGGGK